MARSGWTRRRTWSARKPRGRALLVAVVVGLAVGASGCLSVSTGFTYISHRNPDGTLLGFKLPAKWATFDTKQVLEAANGPLSASESSQIAAGEWMTAFSAAPKPNANFFANAEKSSYPVGFASAQPLTVDERDGFNYSEMRAQILGTDPLSASSPDPYNVTAYNEFLGSGGIRGSKLTTFIRLSSGASATLSQIVEVDPGTNWVFDIGIACKASCFGPNEGVINQVLKSWSVEEIKG